MHVVVVAFYGADDVDASLGALEGAFSVTVVDNSSSAAVSEVTGRHGATYVEPGANLGFGAGVNVALRRLLGSGPVDVLLLNPDAIVTASDVRTLAEQLHARTDSAAVSPRVVDPAGIPQRVMWPFPHPARAVLEALGWGALNQAQDFAIGAVLLLRWEALKEVGLFDERFFLYAEEADWQRRARLLGWSSVLAESVTATHVGAGASTDSTRREHLFHAGQETYIRKWFGAAGWQVYRTAVVLGAAARGVVLRGARGDQARARATLYVKGPRSVAGLA